MTSLGILRKLILPIQLFSLLIPSAFAQTYGVIHTFGGGTDGSIPIMGFTADRAGNLYTATRFGGNGCGVIVEESPSAGGYTESIIWTFQSNNADDGCLPTGGGFLTIDAAGNLYGATIGGGLYKQGTLYELSKDNAGWTEHVVYNFTGKLDGGTPNNGLVVDNRGSFYGSTQLGGAHGVGTIFRVISRPGKERWKIKTIYSLGDDGVQGLGVSPLAIDAAGNIYAEAGADTNQNLYGAVFGLSRVNGAWNATTLYSFCSLTVCSDGWSPSDGVTLHDGNIYGSNGLGGDYQTNCGNIFQLTPSGSGWQESSLVQFDNTEGCNPNAAPTFDSAGNLYAPTFLGGSSGRGTIIELSQSAGSWTIGVLYNFEDGLDGGEPESRLLLRNGNLFGTTAIGGLHEIGVAFELTL